MGRQSPRPGQGPGRQGSLSIGVDNYESSIPPVPAVPPASAAAGTPKPGGTFPSFLILEEDSDGIGIVLASTPATAPGRKTPHMTFQEMGIHGVKAEKQECIIM